MPTKIKRFQPMQEITHEDYKQFCKSNDVVTFHDRIGTKEIKIPIGQPKKIKHYAPKSFELEYINVWSFPKRGNYATHAGNYRGNWPPQLVRNLLLRYSKPEDTILDQMVGSGTTLVECKLLGRNAIGVDINLESIMLTHDRLDFKMPVTLNRFGTSVPTIRTYVGDARNLNLIGDDTIDLIATHPPYVNIIPYSKNTLGDLSAVHSVDEFMREMGAVAKECYRVLMPGKYCAILIGDIRRKKYHIPISFNVLQIFQEAGFVLKEDIIKKQWRCKSTPFWIKRSYEYNFLLLMYEHLFVWEKCDER